MLLTGDLPMNRSIPDVEFCPNCRTGEEPDGINLRIYRLVYRCPNCEADFCSVCGEAESTNQYALVCPHCRTAWFDPAAVSETISQPEGTDIISPVAGYWF